MLSVLVLREKIKEFYGKYSMYIIPFIKFVLVYSALIVLNLNISYSKTLADPFLIIIISLFCAILPFALISTILSIYLLASVSSISIEMAAFMAIFFLILAVMYYGFKPRDSYLLILIPLCFALKIPYIVPLFIGLSANVLSIIPVSAGIVLYYLLIYLKDNVSPSTTISITELGSRYSTMLNTIFSNKLMYLFIIAFVLTIILVYLIHNMSFNHSWDVALAVGVISLLAIIFVGQTYLKIRIDILSFIFSLLISAILAYIYKFFVFDVDYLRTEYVNFEDDEYYYYVKAVPKVSIGVPDIKVKKINMSKKENEDIVKK